MKLPKTIQRHCPHCNKHAEHGVGQAKKRGRSQTHPMSRGSTGRMEKRGLRRGYGNHGKYSRPAIANFKMTGKKMSKKTDLRFTCKTCKKQHTQANGLRAKKVEFI
jgi:large subunit ribosomal protein L44e